MAAVEPPSSDPSLPRQSSVLSRFLSRWRSKSKKGPPETQHNPTQSQKPPLKPSPLPLVLPEDQHYFENLGWTTVTFPSLSNSPSHIPAPGPHPIQKAYEDLFAASQAFFDLPVSEKQKWKHKLGSEEGWSAIPGEKEFITLRTLSYTPDVLKAPAKRYWDLMGAYLDSCLGRLSGSLDLPVGEEEGLRRYVGRCKMMGAQEGEKTPTMIRLFRYEGDGVKVVAEPHADLGLLSLVVGSVPGLEVWDGSAFLDIERGFEGPCATLLGGRQLEKLSNGRFPAGGHRVVSYGTTGASPHEGPNYRYSIVFVLRAMGDVVVDTDSLTTGITGEFQSPVRDITAGKWYDQIRGAHFNINTSLDEREVQRRAVQETKMKAEENGSR